MSHTLPQLDFAYDALEPNFDAKTMEIHHTKHHQAYIDKLNTALAEVPEFADMSIEELVSKIAALPESIRSIVRNHGGGHYNHSLFWKMLSPKETTPSAKLIQAIEKSFGSMDAFKEQFTNAAISRFGSGWAWLVARADGTLSVMSTPNQDNPIMDDTTVTPILGLDVWEHAYYLNYQNRRPDYIAAFWYVVNWDFVSQQFAFITQG